MNYLRLAVLLSGVISLNGCSTMFNNGSQSITAAATNGKEVRVNVTTPSGSYIAKLPLTIVAEPSSFSGISILVQDDCYETAQTIVNKGVTPSYWANIFNLYGFLIDPLTGDMWKYSNMVNVPVTEKRDKPVNCTKL